MDEKPQCETGIHQNPRGEHRLQTLRNQPQPTFSGHISKSKGNKRKNDLLGLHQDKIFCTAKETVNKTKRQPMEWEKIFANETTFKRLVSKIYKTSQTQYVRNK